MSDGMEAVYVTLGSNPDEARWSGPHEVPEHFPMPINEDGDGPVPEDEAVEVVCACGQARCEAGTV